MGRPRGFDETDLVRAATALFGQRGYDALAVDVLIAELGVSRASLYKIYGSKQGLFRAALQDVVDRGARDEAAQDLVLVAALELAPTDEAVRRLSARALTTCFADDPTAVGSRLLTRGGLADPTTQGEPS